MATDLKRTFYGWTDVQPQAAGSQVTEEGQVLVAVLEDGVEKVRPSAGANDAALPVVGFAVFRQRDYATRPVVESKTVPATAPYVVELDHANLVADSVLVIDTLLGTPIVPTIDLGLGQLTFLVAQAGRAMTISYKYNLTVAEAKLLYYEMPINYPDPNLFGTVGVGKAKGRIFTSHFDTSKNYALATALKADANGMVTDQTGAGPTIPARVVSLPTPADPTLGLEFNL